MRTGSRKDGGASGFFTTVECASLRKTVRSRCAFRRVEWMPIQSTSSRERGPTARAAFWYARAVEPPPHIKTKRPPLATRFAMKARKRLRNAASIPDFGTISEPPSEMMTGAFFIYFLLKSLGRLFRLMEILARNDEAVR